MPIVNVPEKGELPAPYRYGAAVVNPEAYGYPGATLYYVLRAGTNPKDSGAHVMVHPQPDIRYGDDPEGMDHSVATVAEVLYRLDCAWFGLDREDHDG